MVWQQDNDPKHTAHIVKARFEELELDVLYWPSNSPDLNPIENVWAILKKKFMIDNPKIRLN